MLIFMLFGVVFAQSQEKRMANTREHKIDSTFAKQYPVAIKSNLLEDFATIPNLGIEISLRKQWSIGLNGMGAWWKSDRRHRYWRIYGGNIYARKYFGKKAEQRTFTGHHLGLYAQALTYDFEWGGRGYMGGIPGGNIFDKMNYGVGLEYGYSLPVARRLNFDFSLGIGYLGGEYREYTPIEDHYVWQYTKKRNWFGPTKAEISLVLLLGKDKKGGK